MFVSQKIPSKYGGIMNRKIVAVLMVLMIVPTWLFAGVTGKISGYVVD